MKKSAWHLPSVLLRVFPLEVGPFRWAKAPSKNSWTLRSQSFCRHTEDVAPAFWLVHDWARTISLSSRLAPYFTAIAARAGVAFPSTETARPTALPAGAVWRTLR